MVKKTFSNNPGLITKTFSAASALLNSRVVHAARKNTAVNKTLEISQREAAVAEAYAVPVMPFAIAKTYLDYGMRDQDRWWSKEQDKPQTNDVEFEKNITLLNGEKVKYIRRNSGEDNSKKQFFIEKNSGQVLNIDNVDPTLLPLYNSDILDNADIGERVILCEGVPATDALRERNILAVGSLNALYVPPDNAIKPLVDKIIYVWPDNDDIGVHYMLKFSQRLKALGANDIRVIKWVDGPWRGDAANFTDSNQALEQLLEAAVGWPAEMLERSTKGVQLSVPDSPYSLRTSYQPAINNDRII